MLGRLQRANHAAWSDLHGQQCCGLRARPRHTLRARPCAAASVATQLVTDGLILGRGEPGSWDEAGIGSPVVRCYLGDNEERWVMWYSGRAADAKPTACVDAVAASAGSTGVTISSNGVDWLRGSGRVSGERGENAASDVGMIMEPNKDWWWFDTAHMQVSDVQILSNSSVQSGVGVFWMFYTGGAFNTAHAPPNFPGIDASAAPQAADASPAQQPFSGQGAEAGPGSLEGFRLRPGLAMSQDGRNWARIEADHHSGALFDVGAPGEWDAAFIGTPQMLAVGPRDMRLFYHSFDATRGRFVVGLATSPDGFRWAKQGVVFDPVQAAGKADPTAHDAKGAAALQVVRDVDNRQYVMFYEAVAANNRRSIGMAVSKDGKKGWQRCPYPVLEASSPQTNGTQEAWDQGAVGQPCAVSMSAGRWRLYYAGRKSTAGPYEGIGLALSHDGGTTFQGMPSQFKRRTSN